ncbi:MAG: TolC family protein, partial [Lysobacteraceae bacterium]
MSSLKNLVIVSALAAALGGCTTVGPDFKAPAAAPDAAYRHAAAGNEAARLPAQWWTVFGDATLDRLEQRALRDNPGVQAAAQRLLQAQAQLGVVRAGQMPSVAV